MATQKRSRQDEEWLARLEDNRQRLASLADSLGEEAGINRPLAESVGDIITRDYEDADFAQAISDREIGENLVSLLSENREQVEHALDRLAQGQYGVCEDCGEQIPSERLKFRPEATRCVPCQGRWDREHRRTA